jgi:predicted PurR-regulated permease PerM
MKKNYNTYFFFAILIGLTVLAFFMMKSFLIPFLFALVLVHFFSPVYEFLLEKTGMKVLSSIFSCLFIALIIIAPALIILTLAVNEVQAAISNLVGDPSLLGKISDIIKKLSAWPFFQSVYFEKIFNQDSILSALKNFSQGFLFILQGAYSGVLRFIFAMFIMFFSLFYMFIDGKRFLKKMIELIPLQKKYDKSLLKGLNSMIRATIKGTIVMAILQGIIGSFLFWATGVASPLFFGVLMAIFSVIPPVGSGLVWLPVGIVMIFLGHLTAGLAIILTGLLVIGTMDNVLRAKLVGNDTQMHPLLILFSTLSGIAYFGIAGFIIGPIIVSLLVSLWDIYVLEMET